MPSPQVINNQLSSKENTRIKLMSISTELKYMKWITFLHDFTYALLRARRQRSIMCLYLFVSFFI